MQRLATSLLLALAVDAFRMKHQRSRENLRTKYHDNLLRERGPFSPPPLKPEDFNQCHLSQSDCSIEEMTEATLVYADSDISRCWNGDPFAFLVHPGRTDKLLYYIPGGGVCYEFPILLPGATQLCMSTLEDGLTNTGYRSGVMAYDNVANVFQDYTFVSPPYCTGGAHVANTTVEVLWRTRYQYDYSNNEFARSWALRNFDRTLQSLVIMGSSAGALGAVLWTDTLLSTFKYKKASVLMDSYMGIFPGDTLGRLLRNFDACNLPILKDFRDACQNGDFKLEAQFEHIIAKYPNVAFGNLQAKTDTIQRAFHAVVALTFLNLDVYISGERFYESTNEVMQKYNKYPNYVAYFVDSGWHTFTQWDLWYTTTVVGENTTKTDGKPKIFEWTAQVVNHESASSQCFGPLKPNGQKGTSYCDEQLFPKTLNV